MPLKVLLADDSAAIKKVVQLSLQDFGVELRSVGSGKDVMDVARSFKPDIAFVDVLLPHKTGYEIATEIKSDASLKKTPVIMLWSSFMAFDDAKFKASGAEDKLEKPFEVSGLRSLITKYVQKSQTNPIAKHLDFPALDFAMPAQTTQTNSAIPKPEQPVGWNMDSFDDISAFMKETQPDKTSTPITSEPMSSEMPAAPDNTIWSGDNEWVRKDLGKFQVPIPDEGQEENTVAFQYSESAISNSDFLLKPSATPAHSEPVELNTPPAEPITPTPKTPSKTGVTEIGSPLHAQFESSHTQVDPKTLVNMDELRAETRKIIEQVVWKVVPEIATNIIREELKRLLNEESK